MFLQAEAESCPKASLFFLGCSSLVSVSPPFPDLQLFELSSWNSGKVMEAGWRKLKHRGHRKAIAPTSPTGYCSVPPFLSRRLESSCMATPSLSFLCYETSMSQEELLLKLWCWGSDNPEQTEAGENAFEHGSLLWSVNQPHVAGKEVKSMCIIKSW